MVTHTFRFRALSLVGAVTSLAAISYNVPSPAKASIGTCACGRLCRGVEGCDQLAIFGAPLRTENAETGRLHNPGQGEA